MAICRAKSLLSFTPWRGIATSPAIVKAVARGPGSSRGEVSVRDQTVSTARCCFSIVEVCLWNRVIELTIVVWTRTRMCNRINGRDSQIRRRSGYRLTLVSSLSYDHFSKPSICVNYLFYTFHETSVKSTHLISTK